MKEGFKLFGLGTAIWLWIVGLVVAASLIGLAFYGYQLNLMRRAQVHSTGFVQSQVDQMSKNMTQFAKNEVEIAKYEGNDKVLTALHSQQMGIVLDMWFAYDQIPQDAKDSVPTNILTFLNTHPRGWQP
jgi:hypothetical protein